MPNLPHQTPVVMFRESLGLSTRLLRSAGYRIPRNVRLRVANYAYCPALSIGSVSTRSGSRLLRINVSRASRVTPRRSAVR